MTMLQGIVRNGVIVLEGDSRLPEGTQVLVAQTSGAAPSRQDKHSGDESLQKVLKKFAGVAKGLPADFARNHDHYIHGAPKRSEKE